MKKVTLGWDLKPTILLEGGFVFPRSVEDIIHKHFYPGGSGTWPIDPETGEKLPMEEYKP